MRQYFFLVLTVCVLILGLAGCEVNKATGRSQFVPLGWDWEIALGAEAQPELAREYGGSVQDPRLVAYVNDIGHRLARHTVNEVPNLPWEFTLLDSDVINAFALPGGKVFFSRGLAARLTDEAQMALVLGHEIGHVTARHGAERLSQTLVAQLGAELAGSVLSGQGGWGELTAYVVGQGAGAYLLKFNRDQESEADRLGMRYMVMEGYDPSAIRDVMRILAEASSGQRQPEFLSTHPYPETRISQGNRLLANEYAHTQNNPNYGRFADRYQRQFLRYLAELPPSPDIDGFALGRSSTWCMHCALGE
ncbi:MAG: M48 family metallopeptidase [Phycisphaeraceae bacterium]|nr:M48 family metallopeptidase [Phycisphaeraceae bacterium]